MKLQLKNYFITAIVVFMGALAALFLFLLGFKIAYAGKVYPRISFSGINLSGKTMEETENAIGLEIQNFINKTVALNYNSTNIAKARPEEIGIKFFPKNTAIKIYSIGKNKNPFLAALEQLSALAGKYKNVELEVEIDDAKFKYFTGKNILEFENPARNASLSFNEKTQEFELITSSGGKIFDREELQKWLFKRASRLNTEPVNLTLVNDYPEVENNEVEEAKKEAKNLLESDPDAITYEDKSIKIDKETLINWLEFYPKPESPKNNKILGIRLNERMVKDYLTELSTGINKEPVNAQFTVVNGRVAAFALSQNGIKIEIDKSFEKISDNILKGVKETSLEFVETEPEITTENINTLEINTLLSVGVSDFAGSPSSRIHNIKVGSSKFNGVLLKPDEEFSFNTILEEVGPKQGYLPELVIKKDKTIPEYGGGLCQVSTTAFRAAILSGVDITERYPHSFPPSPARTSSTGPYLLA